MMRDGICLLLHVQTKLTSQLGSEYLPVWLLLSFSVIRIVVHVNTEGGSYFARKLRDSTQQRMHVLIRIY